MLATMEVGITGNRVFRPNVRPGLYRRDWPRTACRYHRSISIPLGHPIHSVPRLRGSFRAEMAARILSRISDSGFHFLPG